MKATLLLALLVTGCACKQPKPVQPEPPVRVSRCHALVEGITCGDAADRYVTLCTCTGDV